MIHKSLIRISLNVDTFKTIGRNNGLLWPSNLISNSFGVWEITSKTFDFESHMPPHLLSLHTFSITWGSPSQKIIWSNYFSLSWNNDKYLFTLALPKASYACQSYFWKCQKLSSTSTKSNYVGVTSSTHTKQIITHLWQSADPNLDAYMPGTGILCPRNNQNAIRICSPQLLL